LNSTLFTKPAFKLTMLAVLGLMLATPLFKPAMLCGDDFQFHLINTIELDRMWSEGVWYPRWSPNVAFGRGLPTFNFYPPLPRYLSTAMHRLGLPIRESVKATMVLALMLAGPAMYLFARSVYGERAGMVAGVAFAFAPYLANDALQRLAVNETIALVMMPLVLLAFERLNAPSARLPWGRVIVAALAAATLVLTHLLMAMMFAPSIAGYWLLVWQQSDHRRAFTGRVALAIILALGLSAFFWLPYLAEVGSVQMWRARVWELTGEPLYPLHLRSLNDILLPTMLWPDYSVNNPILQRMLALPQVICALIAVVLVRRSPSRFTRAVTILFGLTLVISIFLIVHVSKPVWDLISPLQMVQFPWRFLGPASLAAALLTGVLWANVRFQKWATIVLDAVLIVVLMAWTLPWLRPFLCDIEPNPSGHFVVWVDQRTEGAGSTGELVPRWVETPQDDSPLTADLLAGRPLDRLDRESLPEGAQAQPRTLRSQDSTWQVNSPQTFTATFQNNYFPGWTVRVDGAPVSIAPAKPTGLIEASLPAGQYQVNLRLEATPAQRLGDAISLGALLVAAVLLVATQSASIRGVPALAGQAATGSNVASSPQVGAPVPAWEWMGLGIITIVLFVVRLGLSSIAPPAVPLGPHMPSTATRTNIDLDGQVRLIGYEFSSPTLQAAQPLTVTLYWQTQGLLLTSYKSFVHVTDANGQLVAQSDVVPRNWTYPTSGWLPNEWIGDTHKLDIPENVTGPLDVWAGMYDPDTSQRLNIAGSPDGRVKLGTLRP